MTDRAGSVRALTVGVVLTVILSPVTGLVAAQSTAPGSHPAPDTDGVDVTGGPESTAGLLAEAVSPERPLSYTSTAAEDTGDRGGNDTENRTVAPGDPPTVATSDIRGLEPRTVEANETLTVGIVTENTGPRAGTQTLTFAVDGVTVGTEQVTLASGETETVRFTHETDSSDTGTHTMTASGENDTLRETLRVTEPEDDHRPIHWQVDFGAGPSPPAPPAYWPNDLLAALGNSSHGVLRNPSVLRQANESQLGAVRIVDNESRFDDDGDPTEVTVRFELADDAEPRDLHLAVYTLPGPFDREEVDQQELFELSNGTYEGGETGELTVSVPQPGPDGGVDPTCSSDVLPWIDCMF